MSHCQLSKEERIQLEAYLRADFDQKEIASRLERSESTISREIWRNGDPVTGHYDARAAHQRTRKRRRKPNKKLATDPNLAESVMDMLISNHWSPDEIAGVLCDQGIAIHFMTIYRWIYAERRELILFLRHGKKHRWRRKRKWGQPLFLSLLWSSHSPLYLFKSKFFNRLLYPTISTEWNIFCNRSF